MTEIFVFGSNLAGRHGKGAALHALQHYGAIYGQGEGLQGHAYGIPTKDYRIQTLDLITIRKGVDRFLRFARERQHLAFSITRIGCGLAGYNDAQIGPMFDGAPPNCRLPTEWAGLARNASTQPPEGQPDALPHREQSQSTGGERGS